MKCECRLDIYGDELIRCPHCIRRDELLGRLYERLDADCPHDEGCMLMNIIRHNNDTGQSFIRYESGMKWIDRLDLKCTCGLDTLLAEAKEML